VSNAAGHARSALRDSVESVASIGENMVHFYIKARRKANPEWKETRRKARAKYFERTDYMVSHGNYLPLGTIVKVKASHPSNPAMAILGNGLEIPFSCLRKMGV